MGRAHATKQGKISKDEKEVALTKPPLHNTNPTGSPITVKIPPQLADKNIAEP